MENNELYHYGVKGMKWGVRRAERKAKLQALKEHDRKINSDWERAKTDRKLGKITKYSDQYMKAKEEKNAQRLEKALLSKNSRIKVRERIAQGENATKACLKTYGKQTVKSAAISAAAVAAYPIVASQLLARFGLMALNELSK